MAFDLKRAVKSLNVQDESKLHYHFKQQDYSLKFKHIFLEIKTVTHKIETQKKNLKGAFVKFKIIKAKARNVDNLLSLFKKFYRNKTAWYNNLKKVQSNSFKFREKFEKKNYSLYNFHDNSTNSIYRQNKISEIYYELNRNKKIIFNRTIRNNKPKTLKLRSSISEKNCRKYKFFKLINKQEDNFSLNNRNIKQTSMTTKNSKEKYEQMNKKLKIFVLLNNKSGKFINKNNNLNSFSTEIPKISYSGNNSIKLSYFQLYANDTFLNRQINGIKNHRRDIYSNKNLSRVFQIAESIFFLFNNKLKGKFKRGAKEIWRENGGGNLVLRMLKSKDSGVYSCILKNVAGEDRASVEILVEGPPHIVDPPKNLSLKEGSLMKLPCRWFAYPSNVTIVWYRNDTDVRQIHSIFNRWILTNDGSIMLNDVQQWDTAWYKCRLYNGLKDLDGNYFVEARAFVDVMYLPRVSEIMPARLTFFNGTQSKIRCPSIGNPQAYTVIWAKNGRKLKLKMQPLFEERVNASKINHTEIKNQLNSERIFQTFDGTLVFKPILTSSSTNSEDDYENDEGNYTCHPYSKLGAGLISTLVEVTIKGPPFFKIRPDVYYRFHLGQSRSIQCMAAFEEREPAPVTWIKIASGYAKSDMIYDRVHYYDRDGDYLTLKNLTAEDSGVYACLAGNSSGNVVISETQIKVLEDIGKVTSSFTMEDIQVVTSFNHAWITWLPNIEVYKKTTLRVHHMLWLREKGVSIKEEEWTRFALYFANDINVTFSSILLNDLKPSTEYQALFSCRDDVERSEESGSMVTFKTLGQYY